MQYLENAWFVALSAFPNISTNSTIQVLSLSDNDWKNLPQLDELWHLVFGERAMQVADLKDLDLGCRRHVLISPTCQLSGYPFVGLCPTFVPTYTSIPALRPYFQALRQRVFMKLGFDGRLKRNFSNPSSNKIIFSPRKPSGTGRWLRTPFDELRNGCATLRMHVQKVAFENISMVEQIQVMSNARVLIAVEGAVFANRLWMPAGGVLVVIHIPKLGYKFPVPVRWFDYGELSGLHVVNVLTVRPQLNVSKFCSFLSGFLKNTTGLFEGSITDVAMD